MKRGGGGTLIPPLYQALSLRDCPKKKVTRQKLQHDLMDLGTRSDDLKNAKRMFTMAHGIHGTGISNYIHHAP